MLTLRAAHRLKNDIFRHSRSCVVRFFFSFYLIPILLNAKCLASMKYKSKIMIMTFLFEKTNIPLYISSYDLTITWLVIKTLTSILLLLQAFIIYYQLYLPCLLWNRRSVKSSLKNLLLFPIIWISWFVAKKPFAKKWCFFDLKCLASTWRSK